MAEILLTHSNHLYSDRKQVRKMQPYPPLQTLIAAAVLRERGYSVAVCDPALAESPESAFQAALDEHRPRIVGVIEDNFNFLTKMCLTRNRELAFVMCAAARRAGIRTFANGSDATDRASEYLEAGFDFVVLGEPEGAFDQVLRRDGGGLVRGDRVEIDSLPEPAWDLIDAIGYRQAWKQAHGYFSMNLVSSRGCPYRCNFCGVVAFSGSREKMESPARTEGTLRHLVEKYGADAVQFYDNNFFLREDHTRELADRMAPLKLRWWCEGRTDIMMKYSDATFEALRRAGCTMIFFGAESGSNEILKEMNKDLRAEDTIALASRIRRFGIIPEFSIIFGNPKDPEGDTHGCIGFIRQLKRLNPDAEIIVEHYTPVPQRSRMYGGVEDKIQFPTTPDEWATERWQRFATQKDPQTPWLRPATKNLIDNFELVVSSRWPTVQDIRLPNWGRMALKALSSWRYRLGVYAAPFELKWMQQLIELRKPKAESL